MKVRMQAEKIHYIGRVLLTCLKEMVQEIGMKCKKLLLRIEGKVTNSDDQYPYQVIMLL